jgi:antibiotic biosynthesis monooxygenase (ABM) superfamily enzyme
VIRLWLTVWALVTGLSLALDPVLGGWPLPLRTLVLSGLVVAAMDALQRRRKVR